MSHLRCGTQRTVQGGQLTINQLLEACRRQGLEPTYHPNGTKIENAWSSENANVTFSNGRGMQVEVDSSGNVTGFGYVYDSSDRDREKTEKKLTRAIMAQSQRRIPVVKGMSIGEVAGLARSMGAVPVGPGRAVERQMPMLPPNQMASRGVQPMPMPVPMPNRVVERPPMPMLAPPNGLPSVQPMPTIMPNGLPPLSMAPLPMPTLPVQAMPPLPQSSGPPGSRDIPRGDPPAPAPEPVADRVVLRIGDQPIPVTMKDASGRQVIEAVMPEVTIQTGQNGALEFIVSEVVMSRPEYQRPIENLRRLTTMMWGVKTAQAQAPAGMIAQPVLQTEGGMLTGMDVQFVRDNQMKGLNQDPAKQLDIFDRSQTRLLPAQETQVVGSLGQEVVRNRAVAFAAQEVEHVP